MDIRKVAVLGAGPMDTESSHVAALFLSCATTNSVKDFKILAKE